MSGKVRGIHDETLSSDSPCRPQPKPTSASVVSYSHQDIPIVEQLERAYVVLGMEYLRDVHFLRAERNGIKLYYRR